MRAELRATLRVALALMSSALTVAAQAPAAPDLARLAWRTTEVGLGVTLRTADTANLFDAPQSLAILVIDDASAEVVVRIAAPEPFARVLTSRLARDQGALAAVNGGFFDTSNGTPDGLLRIGGRTLAPHAPRRDAGMTIGGDGRIGFSDLDADTARSLAAADALAAWPRLLRDGAIARPEGFSQTDRRHPRTAVGRTADDRGLFLTVDGRTERAAGMTLVELAVTMQALGCTDAMNLDGGGSTTMWLDGRIVNHPSDNERFDHAGERAVANAVLITAPRILVRDEESFTLGPRGAWIFVADPARLDGDAMRGRGADAHADIALTPPGPGPWHVELRVRPGDGARGSIDGIPFELSDPSATGWRRIGAVARPGDEAIEVGLRPLGGALLVDGIRLVEAAARR